jgi:hypothetical protein
MVLMYINSMPFLLLCSIFLLLLCSCGGSVEDNDIGSGGISVMVMDATTNLPLKDVSVQLLGRDKKPRITDSKGGIVYKDLPAGNGYTFRIEAAGYASILCEAEVLDSLMSGKSVRLPRLGVKLQGYLAYMDLSTNAINTQWTGNGDAKVRLKLGLLNECELLNPYREAATGLNGSYLFDSLPERANYDLMALETKIDGILYGQFFIQSDGILGLSGDIAKAPLGVYENAVSLEEEFRLLSAPDTISPNRKISLVFSKDINKSRTGVSAFSITGVNYAIDTKWKGNRTLEISPVGGIWKIDDTISISNAVSLHAIDGTVIPPGNLAIVTVTNGALGTVSEFWLENAGTGTALNITGDSLDLNALLSEQKGLIFRWNKAGNATGYAIYAKCANDINYTQIETDLSFASDTSAVWGYSEVHYCVENDKQTGFFVQAKNARQQTNSNIIAVTGYSRF